MKRVLSQLEEGVRAGKSEDFQIDAKTVEVAKLRRTYPCGNVKSNCNFVFHNGERKEIT